MDDSAVTRIFPWASPDPAQCLEAGKTWRIRVCPVCERVSDNTAGITRCTRHHGASCDLPVLVEVEVTPVERGGQEDVQTWTMFVCDTCGELGHPRDVGLHDPSHYRRYIEVVERGGQEDEGRIATIIHDWMCACVHPGCTMRENAAEAAEQVLAEAAL